MLSVQVGQIVSLRQVVGMGDNDIVGRGGAMNVLVVDICNACRHKGISVGKGDKGACLVGGCGEIVAVVGCVCDASGIRLAWVGDIPNLQVRAVSAEIKGTYLTVKL